jgi:ferric-dicitrate binding protein FerR (iron transport regulator)
MSNWTLEREWARTQIEAMADGTLNDADRARMERALAGDGELRGALREATEILTALQRTKAPLPRAGLLISLLFPGLRANRRNAVMPRTAFASGVAAFGVAATALIVMLFGSLAIRTPDPAGRDAVRDFQIAMNYLHQTAVVTRDEVGQQLGDGLRTAIEIGTHTLAAEDAASDSNGG